MSKGKRTDSGLVYFMRRADGVGPIKIGCSKVPLQRLDQMQAWSPEPLEVVTSAPGTFADEERLHRQFEPHRLHGEWFEAAPAVLSLLARVSATGELPPPPVNDKWLRMAEMYNGGATLQAIGEAFGITRERVRQILRKAGVPSQGHRPETMRSSVAWRKEKQILSLAKAGHTVPDIASTIGDCANNVRAVLRYHRITVPRKKKQARPETLDKAWAVAADYKSGMLGVEIARKHGIPQPNIYRLLRLIGVKPQRVSSNRVVDDAALISMYRNGATLANVAEHFNCSVVTARKRVVEAGALRSRAEADAIRIAAVRAANRRRRAA